MDARAEGLREKLLPLTDRGAAVVLVAATAALFWKVVFLGRVLYFGDVMLQFLPWRGFANDALHRGLLPLWNPYSFCGEPFLANPQTAVFYPWNLLGLLLSPARCVSWGAVAHTLLAAWGMYLFLRELRASRPGGLVGALVVACGGFMASRHQFPSMIDTLAWFPFALLWTHRMLDRPSLRSGAALAAVTGLHLLAGHAQMSLFILALQAVYTAQFFLAERVPPAAALKRVGWLLLPLVGGGLLAAVQLLPTAELVRHSTRGGLSVSELSLFSVPWWQLPGLVYPLLFGAPALGNYWGMGNYWEMCGYVGAVPLLLAVCGLVRSPRRERWLLAGLFGVALLLAVGRYSPVFEWAARIVPVLRLFRAPARFLFFCSFALAVLAAFGADALLAPGGVEKALTLLRRLAWTASAVTAAILATSLAAGASWRAGVEALVARCFAEGGKSAPPEALSALAKAALLSGQLALTIGMVWFGLAYLLMRGVKDDRPRAPTLALVGLTALELCVTGASLNPTTRAAFLSVRPRVAAQLAPDTPRFRCWTPLENVNDWWSRYASYVRYGKADAETLAAAFNGFAPNLNMPCRVLNASGYNPLRVRRLWDELKQVEEQPDTFASQRFLDAAAVRHVVRFHPDPPRVAAIRRSTALPRATLWSQHDVTPEAAPRPGAKPRSPAAARFEANRISIRCAPANRSVLVLSDTLYPGWTAWLDNRPVALHRAFRAFRSVDLPPGSHTVRFVYLPQSFRFGAFLTLLALSILSLVLFRGFLRRRLT